MDASRLNRIAELARKHDLTHNAAGTIEGVEHRGVSYLTDRASVEAWGQVVREAARRDWTVGVTGGSIRMLTVRDPDHDDA